MSPGETTCWTMIEAAARGSPADREQFARHYLEPVRAYLTARWRGTSCQRWLEDAVQEVFVECFRTDGPLSRANPEQGFRPFFYGVVRNVARRMEERVAAELRKQADGDVDLAAIPDNENSLSHLFDRAWALSVMQQAASRQKELAAAAGAAALRRLELLRLRFEEGLPIRDIAARWQVDAAHLHHEYRKARDEFKAALFQVVAFHHPGTVAAIESECASLLVLLQ